MGTLSRSSSFGACAAIAMAIAAGCGDDAAGAGGGGGATAAGTGGDAPGVDPFCATRPVLEFCEDFDGAALPGRFSEQVIEGATVAIDAENPASPPGALRVTTTGGEARGFVAGAFEAGKRFRLFQQVRIDALATEGEATLGRYLFEIDGAPYDLAYGVRADGTWWVAEAAGGDDAIVSDGALPIELGAWVSVRFDVDFLDDGTGTATLRFGNDVAAETEALAPPALEGAPRVEVGVVSTAGAWDVRFDNVTVEVDG